MDSGTRLTVASVWRDPSGHVWVDYEWKGKLRSVQLLRLTRSGGLQEIDGKGVFQKEDIDYDSLPVRNTGTSNEWTMAEYLRADVLE